MAIFCPAIERQFLLMKDFVERNNQAPSNGELIEKRLRHVFGRGWSR